MLYGVSLMEGPKTSALWSEFDGRTYWVWSLIIFLVFRGLVSVGFRHHNPMGVCGGAFPPTIAARKSKGGNNASERIFFMKNAL